MPKLIVNADDFGFNAQITDGIIACHLRGCVTSATLMANMPAAEYAAEQAKKLPELSVGIHFVLNVGRPVSDPEKIPALVKPDGTFRSTSEVNFLAKHSCLPIGQIEREFAAQLKRFLGFGIIPTHCDSHHNITVNPQPCLAMMRVIRKHHIKRLRTFRGLHRLDRTAGWNFRILLRMVTVNLKRAPKSTYFELLHWYWRRKGYRLPGAKCGFYKLVSSSPLEGNLAQWGTLLRNLPPGISELAVHPGLPSDDPLDNPQFREKRILQYQLFSDPKAKELARRLGVELVNYRAL